MDRRRNKCSIPDCCKPAHGGGYCGPHYKRWKRHGDPLAETNYGLDFWDRVDMTGTCWLWIGARDAYGYGRARPMRPGGSRLAHRVSWELTRGQLDSTDCVLHRCDNPPCVRPLHLFLGSRADNSADMIAKGRARFNDDRAPESFTHGVRNGRAKLTEDQVIEMRQRALAGERYQDLAKVYGISASRANGIILGNGWRHIWPYFDNASGKNRPEAIPRKRTIK